jgi:GNAT superfamily N-acetyltransferase
MFHEIHTGEYTLSTDPPRLDLAVIVRFLSTSYWSPGIPAEVVRRAIAGSICFALYHQQKQIGFARVVTDRATFAYLADVFVLEGYRGRGMAKWMKRFILEHPELQGLRRFLLATRDARGLYEQFGFRPLAQPERFMEIAWPEIYLRQEDASTLDPGKSGRRNGSI